MRRQQSSQKGHRQHRRLQRAARQSVSLTVKYSSQLVRGKHEYRGQIVNVGRASKSRT